MASMAFPSPGEPDLSHWGLVDALTVQQAACLWAGVDASKNQYARTISEVSRLVPITQLISSAIQSGRLVADSSKNLLTSLGDYSNSLVTRDDLMAFASAKGQRPAFLFDTLMPDAAGSEPPAVVDHQTIKSKGGRPRKYDWDALTIEIIRIANSPDGLPESQAALVEQLLQWCENTWGKQPAESSVKTRTSKVFRALGLGQKLPGVSGG